MIDFIKRWSKKTGIAVTYFVAWLGITPSKYYDWQSRYGKANEHNALVPRDFWLEDWEKQAIVNFHLEHPLEGYRRLTFMMLDQDIVAVSPSSVYRVLSAADLLRRWNGKVSKKGNGFVQPLQPHEHWHIDVSYINLCGTFYYLCSLLDGCSRYLIHWELRETMTEKDVEIILQRAREKFPQASPRIISDNGPQFIAKDFKEYIRLVGMTHVRTSPFYPQSNGKLERYHKTRPSKPSAFAPRSPCRSKKHEHRLPIIFGITTMSGYIAPLVTSHPRTNLRAAINRFSKNAIKKSRPPERPENKNE